MTEVFNVWDNVLAEIQAQINPQMFKVWFNGTKLLNPGEKIIRIETPGIFIQSMIESRYGKMIEIALRNQGLDFEKITYEIAKSGKIKTKPREVSRLESVKEKATENIREIQHQALSGALKNGLNPRYTIDNFIIGSNNDLAASAAKAILENPGTKYNPFFLYGGPGLGKTHLVQAIGNSLLKNNPKLKILYTPINHFYTDFINSIQKKTVEEFKAKFRKLDVLIIDDFQFIVNKDKSQEEFFNIFNDLYHLNKQIIVTSDRLPSQIQTVDERLASRLTWCGAFDIQMPNFEDRCAILKSKAEFKGVEIEDEAIEYIAENIKTNIRDLEGEFSRIIAVSELKGMTPLQLIQEGYINPIMQTRTKTASPKQILEKVAKYYEMSVKEMCSKSRVSHIKHARQVSMYLLSEELSLSTPKIALEVGVKDHTTVMHGIKKIKNDMSMDFGLRDQISAIREKIHA